MTDSTGKATGTGVSPNTISTGWTYQGQYAGSSIYNPASTAVRTYNTLKHTSSLSLVSPSTVVGGATYGVSGTLTRYNYKSTVTLERKDNNIYSNFTYNYSKYYICFNRNTSIPCRWINSTKDSRSLHCYSTFCRRFPS